MSMKNKEEAMMEAGYSPGDVTKPADGKENELTDSPFSDESKSQMMVDYKQDRDEPLRDTDLAKNSGAAESQSDSENNQDGKKIKKRHRRRNRGGKNHRRWKPYDKMSWSEKKELEEKETRRATKKREAAFQSGHPVAPYNTTQFLMDDHFKNEAISPDLHRYNSKESNSSDSSSDFYDEDENQGFQEKNFMDTFNDFRKQELLNRSKEELVRDYVDMEMKLEELQKDMTSNRNERCSRDSSDGNSVSSAGEKEVDLEEYLRLKAENDRLKQTNTKLQAQLIAAQKLDDLEEVTPDIQQD